MTHVVPPPVVGILLLACSSPAWASQSPPDTTKYQAVNDSFALILAEYLDPRLASARDSGPSLYMLATTRRTFSCLLPLGMSLKSRGSHIDLYLAGVPRGPQLCPSAIGPARGTVRLPAKVGAYDIVIRRPDGLEDTYTLLVTDTLTEVTTLASRYTTLTPVRRWRARRNTLSMTCTLPWKGAAVDSSQSWVCTTFAAWLRDSLGMRLFRFGEGPAIPFPDAPPQQWGDVLYFEYTGAGAFPHGYSLLQRFSHQYMASKAPNASVRLINWRGAEVDSYRCRPDQQWCQPSHQFPPW